MAELCLVGYTYRGYPSAYALERAADFGYQSVEVRDWADIALDTPAHVAEALARVRPAAEARGLTVRSVFYSPLPVSRRRERAAEEQAFAEVIRAVADQGVSLLHTRLSLLRPNGSEVISAGASEADYACVQAILERVATAAEQRGVRIAIETHMGTIHDTAAAQQRIVSSVESPVLVASLDLANMLVSHRQEALPEAIDAFGSRIGYVHIKNVKLSSMGYDWNIPVRWGDINYYLVLQALRGAGYAGPLAIEYCGTGDPDVFAEDDARYVAALAARVGL